MLLATQTNAGTRAGYRRDINTFMRWWSELRPAALSTAGRPLEASRSDIEQYAAWLAAVDPPLAPATRARRLAVVSACYELAEQHDLIGRTPMRGVRRPTVENEDAHLGLDGDHADQLLRTAETWTDRQQGTLVVLLLLCGFRISEALGIRTVDITPRERGRKAEVRIRRKGRDHRTVFDIDDEWLAHRLTALTATTADDRPVFDLDRFQAGRALARIGRQAGIDPPPTRTSSGTRSAPTSSRPASTPARCSASRGTAICAPPNATSTRSNAQTDPSPPCSEPSSARSATSSTPPRNSRSQSRPSPKARVTEASGWSSSLRSRAAGKPGPLPNREAVELDRRWSARTRVPKEARPDALHPLTVRP